MSDILDAGVLSVQFIGQVVDCLESALGIN